MEIELFDSVLRSTFGQVIDGIDGNSSSSITIDTMPPDLK